MLRRLRHLLVLILFLLLPFHALFVTVGTKMLMGPGQPPLVLLAIWKELLIAAIFLIGIAELASGKSLPTYFQYINILKVSQRGTVQMRWRTDTPTVLILSLLFLALVLSATHYSLLITHFTFGFKYLLLPLIFFLVLKSLPWDTDFLEHRMFPALLVVSAIVAAYGIFSFFLPQNFFSALGYSDAHSLYSPETPLSAFQLISGTGIRRIQSTFAGPNQLGMWLLIPWSIGIVRLITHVMPSSAADPSIHSSRSSRARSTRDDTAARIEASLHLLLIGITLFLTFSRAAWIAAFVIALVAVCRVLRGPVRETILITLVTAVCVAVATLAYVSPQLFLRGISNEQHLERLRSGFAAILEQPLGRGLGTAGPAANRLQDACVYFPDGADTSWARARKDLCIFVGGEQVQPSLPPAKPVLSLSKELASQPSARKCQCAFLPENWYLQVGVELGILGMILFVTLVLSVLLKLSAISYQLSAFLALLGLSIAALFLHAFEDSAVAYTIWGMVGIVLGGRDTVHETAGGIRGNGIRE